jgi:Na+/H+ antiporter NhaD/arsenite permease-like protein
MIASAVLSALILNDAVVLLFTPVLVKATRALGVDATPYLVGEALAANVGSVATPVGNPQNAFIAIASGIPFGTYVAALLPVAAACLGVALVLTWLVFRRSLAAPFAASPEQAVPARDAVTEPRLLRAALLLLAVVFAGFLASHALGLSIAHVAFAGGLAAVAATLVLAPRRAPAMARGIDATILVFFVGLFWVIAGFREAGLSDELARLFLGPGAPSLVALTGWSAALSNIVSNVPAVILIAPTLQSLPAGLGTERLWLALAASSTLAGNATLVGAAANVIVAETARNHGADLSVRRFMLAGVPVTVATLALAVAILGR